MPSFFYVLKPYRVFSLFHLVAVDVWFVVSAARERVQKRLEITTRNILRTDVKKPSYAGLPNTAKILGRYIEKITLAFPTEVHFQNYAKLEKRKCEQAFFCSLPLHFSAPFAHSAALVCHSLAGKWKLNF